MEDHAVQEEKVAAMPFEPDPGQPFKTLRLRLPVELYTHLVRLATKERRSLQNQLLVLLEQALHPLDGVMDSTTRRP